MHDALHLAMELCKIQPQPTPQQPPSWPSPPAFQSPWPWKYGPPAPTPPAWTYPMYVQPSTVPAASVYSCNSSSRSDFVTLKETVPKKARTPAPPPGLATLSKDPVLQASSKRKPRPSSEPTPRPASSKSKPRPYSSTSQTSPGPQTRGRSRTTRQKTRDRGASVQVPKPFDVGNIKVKFVTAGHRYLNIGKPWKYACEKDLIRNAEVAMNNSEALRGSPNVPGLLWSVTFMVLPVATKGFS